MTSGEPAKKFPRPTYQQLEALCAELKDENGTLKAKVSRLNDELRVQREKYEQEQREQQAAAAELFEVFKDFCQQSQPQATSSSVLTTPRLGVESRASTDSSSWADLENKVHALSARVQNKPSSPQRLGSFEEARRSPARRSSMSTLRRSRLSLGGRRDPVGGFGEVVAQIARDRATRQQKLANQENAPVEPSLTPPPISQTDRASSVTNSFVRCSFGRSPCSSLNHASTATPSAPDNMVCMHTNMLANMSGDRTASPCVDSTANSTAACNGRPLDRDPLLDIAPTHTPTGGAEESLNFAEQVLADITPSAQPEGLANLLASVVQKAKSNAVKKIAEEAESGSSYGYSESAPLCAM